MDNERPNLKIVIGLPGSGKSTYIQNVADPEKEVWVSRDEIRFSLMETIKDFKKREAETYKIFIESIKFYLNKGYTVWADATNVSMYHRRKIVRQIPKSLYNKLIAYYFNIPYGVCCQRNAQRKGLRIVPEASIYKMSQELTIPDKKEGFKEIYIVDLEEEERVKNKG